MLPALVLVLVLMVIFVPQIWVKYVLKKYSQPIEMLPGTGGELAKHLVKQFNLEEVTVEATEDAGDHYDPKTKKICLSEDNFEGKSLTAVTVAAHEFGHALQDHTDYKFLSLRTRIVEIAGVAQKVASFILIASPFTILLVKIPLFSIVFLLIGFSVMCLPVVLHFFTLPVEFDASFNRALPILEKGKYLPASAMPIAKKILIAAALTYVAASLASLLNFYRWIGILRR